MLKCNKLCLTACPGMGTMLAIREYTVLVHMLQDIAYDAMLQHFVVKAGQSGN